MARVLVYGYGNPGRLDDGLGPALVEALATRGPGADVALETGYQLQVEDAALVAPYDLVIFADAHASCPAPFELRELEPLHDADFTTHSLAPEALLALARDLYGSRARGFTLGIRGVRFDDYGEGLSPAARRHLDAAAEFLRQALRDGTGELRCPSPGR
jgi:hydrogenase maturation protease